MAKIAQDKRMQVVIWSAVAVLLVALVTLSFSAFAVETTDGADGEAAGSSSAASSSTAASSGSAASSSGSASSSSSSKKSEVDLALSQDPVSKGTKLGAMDADSAGTVFTFDTPLESLSIEGDLYWAGASLLELTNSRVSNDVLAVGREVVLADSSIDNDIRVAGQSVELQNVVAQDSVDLLALEIEIDEDSAATGYYCGGGTISFAGTSKRFIAYGQVIYFDGVVEGDVTLSAQDIIIGPNAKVTGTMDIRSGQSLEVLSIPESAEIAHIDTTLNHPNTIDQITQIRAAIAPYFQVGSLLFVVVSFILLGLALLWGFGQKMDEANRLIVRYPVAVVVLGVIALMLMFVAIMLGTLLIFTIPLSAVVVCVLLVSALCCIPFTGASLMLMLRGRLRPWLCVALGSGIGGALLFVPYVNVVLFVCSLVYFVGYLVNIAMFGHDREHDTSFHQREVDGDEPHGKTGGILPVAVLDDDSPADSTNPSE